MLSRQCRAYSGDDCIGQGAQLGQLDQHFRRVARPVQPDQAVRTSGWASMMAVKLGGGQVYVAAVADQDQVGPAQVVGTLGVGGKPSDQTRDRCRRRPSRR
jgi:hypothetical protein